MIGRVQRVGQVGVQGDAERDERVEDLEDERGVGQAVVVHLAEKPGQCRVGLSER